ncbi:MAG: hypothetical protein KDJ29_03985 [Hyphomicrobiales bacterium]|nr:hypothetical protein [Hyphomicrobiales bacterium]
MLAQASLIFRTCISVATLACLTAGSNAFAADDFYKGKKISVIIGFAPGGGMDTVGRMFVRHFSNHVPGSPGFVVQNMPGAGATLARNYMTHRAAKDGTVIFYDSWNPMPQIVKLRQARYDYAQFTYLGGLRGSAFMMFGRKDMVPGGLQKPGDIVKAPKLIYVGQGPHLTLDMFGRLALDLLGVKYQYVPGYRGAAAIRLAISRGEGNITTHGLQGYRSGVEPTLTKQGKVMPLWYFPHRDENGNSVKIPAITDMPSFSDVHAQARGGKRDSVDWKAMELMSDIFGSGPNYLWGPPGMPPKATAILRKAFVATMADKAYRAEQQKIFGYIHETVPQQALEKVIAGFSKIDPKVVEYFAKILKK